MMNPRLVIWVQFRGIPWWCEMMWEKAWFHVCTTSVQCNIVQYHVSETCQEWPCYVRIYIYIYHYFWHSRNTNVGKRPPNPPVWNHHEPSQALVQAHLRIHSSQNNEPFFSPNLFFRDVKANDGIWCFLVAVCCSWLPPLFTFWIMNPVVRSLHRSLMSFDTGFVREDC